MKFTVYLTFGLMLYFTGIHPFQQNDSSEHASFCSSPQAYQIYAINTNFFKTESELQQNQPFADSVIINDYTPVLDLEVCNNILIVETGSAFKQGDTVLLIQMKGAVIDSSNTQNFGSVTDYGSAGNYEFNYVKSVNGNSIELLNALSRSYDFERGKVQLIRVPYFADYSPNGVLTCLPWDGSKGGVLAFNVANQLSLTANIDVSSRGFLGGQPLYSTILSCNRLDYFYNGTFNDGAHKGEGIASLSSQKMYGRGALANGGGGGNAHNAGGAGGGNAGTGGQGGNQYPYFEMCSTIIPDVGGVGGKKIVYSNNNNKIFLGGGGGAGHANEYTDKPGGSGGGIVIISANSINSNGHSIISNGGSVQECTSQATGCANDGHSGGGAGGTVLLNINQYQGPLTIQVRGGKGADAWRFNSSIQTTGPGGGGAGGLVWFSQNTQPTNTSNVLTGGLNGVARQHGNSPWGATQGESGQSLYRLQIPIDIIPFIQNIDSVRIKDSSLSCSVFEFQGLAYINNSPISSWFWDLGDGNTATTQHVTHHYQTVGAHTVKLVATDENGCKDSAAVVVNVAAISSDFSYTSDQCNPLAISFIASGSFPLPVYWSFGDGTTSTTSTNPIHVFPEYGTYYVRYSPNSTVVCNDTISKMIIIERPGINTIQNNDTAICAGSSVLISASGLSSYSWEPTLGLSDPDIANPIATPNITTQYIVTGTNTAGCLVRDTILIAVNPLPNIVVTADTAICAGTSLQLSASGATNYLWAPAVSLSGVQIANPVATPVSNTLYSVTGTNDFGCTSGAIVNVSVYPKPIISISADTAICPNSTIQLFASGGNSYEWSPGGSLSSTNIANPLASPIIPTRYRVLVTDAQGCTNIDSVNVAIHTLPQFTLTPNNEICKNDSIRLTASGGDTYLWQASNSLSGLNIPNPYAFPQNTTNYTVTISEKTCNTSAQLSTTINVLPLPTVNAFSQNDIDCSNDQSQLSATGAVSYNWSPAFSLHRADIANPIARPATTTTYTVKGTDAHGCSSADSVTVQVALTNKGGYLMPNAFTPNNDGLNDCYGIRYWGVIENLEFSIFNRWGERVFYTTKPGDCWNGTYKGVKQDAGIFVYMIRAKTFCENDVFKKGTFSLIR